MLYVMTETNQPEKLNHGGNVSKYLLSLIGPLLVAGAPIAYLAAYFLKSGEANVWDIPMNFVTVELTDLLELGTLTILILSVLSVPVYFLAGAMSVGFSANFWRLIGAVSIVLALIFGLISWLLFGSDSRLIFNSIVLVVYTFVFFFPGPHMLSASTNLLKKTSGVEVGKEEDLNATRLAFWIREQLHLSKEKIKNFIGSSP